MSRHKCAIGPRIEEKEKDEPREDLFITGIGNTIEDGGWLSDVDINNLFQDAILDRYTREDDEFRIVFDEAEIHFLGLDPHTGQQV